MSLENRGDVVKHDYNCEECLILLSCLEKIDRITEKTITEFESGLTPEKKRIFKEMSQEDKMKLISVMQLSEEEREKMIQYVRKSNNTYSLGLHNLKNLIQTVFCFMERR